MLLKFQLKQFELSTTGSLVDSVPIVNLAHNENLLLQSRREVPSFDISLLGFHSMMDGGKNRIICCLRLPILSSQEKIKSNITMDLRRRTLFIAGLFPVLRDLTQRVWHKVSSVPLHYFKGATLELSCRTHHPYAQCGASYLQRRNSKSLN